MLVNDLSGGEAGESSLSPESCTMPVPSCDIRLVREVFTEDECTHLLVAAEVVGFGVTDYPKKYRGNLRIITMDTSLASALWLRLKPFIPNIVTEYGHQYEAHGLNECWRLAKYYPGDQFCSHVDATFSSGDLKSMYTVNIYMNGDFTGGHTVFEQGNAEEMLRVVPQPGLCLLFRQPPSAHYSHKGLAVESGVKYLFRSDVMYRRID